MILRGSMMCRQNVTFIDTSILMYILDIDTGKQPHDLLKKAEIQKEFKYILEHTDQELLILTISTIIETGNHIAHIPNGNKLYEVAKRFNEFIDAIINEQEPWYLYGITVGTDDFVNISNSYVEWAKTRVGLGDQTIIYYYQKYSTTHKKRINKIRIWSTDEHLQQFHEENIQSIKLKK